jgi:hypothetical protein
VARVELSSCAAALRLPERGLDVSAQHGVRVDVTENEQVKSGATPPQYRRGLDGTRR